GILKGKIGHTKGAAGAMALARALEVLRRRETPHAPGYLGPHRTPPGPFVATAPHRLAEGASVGVSAFGFGGANWHAVLGTDEAASPSAPSRRVFVAARASVP